MTRLARIYVNGSLHSMRNIEWPPRVGGGIELKIGWVRIESVMENDFGRIVFTHRPMTAEEEARAAGQLVLW